MSQDIAHPLSQEYDHWHEVTRLRYQQFLQSVTALELNDAERHLRVFSKLLRAILEFSDFRLRELLDDSDLSLELVRADHLILGKTLVMVEDALSDLQKIENLQPEQLRSALVERLDLLVRLNNILNKHQIRQVELLFPLFEAKLPGEEATSLASKMNEVMQRAQPN